MVSAWVIAQGRSTHATREEATELLQEIKKGMKMHEFKEAKKNGKSMDLKELLMMIEPSLFGGS